MGSLKLPNYNNESTPSRDVKAPNMFGRAKEEIEALVQSINPKKDSQAREKRENSNEAELKPENSKSTSAPNDGKPMKFIKRAKEEFEEFIHKSSPHRKETHETSNDIDGKSLTSEVKGPNVFERAKEEIEAIVQAINPKRRV